MYDEIECRLGEASVFDQLLRRDKRHTGLRLEALQRPTEKGTVILMMNCLWSRERMRIHAANETARRGKGLFERSSLFCCRKMSKCAKVSADKLSAGSRHIVLLAVAVRSQAAGRNAASRAAASCSYLRLA